MPVDSNVDVWASLRREFYAIRQLCCSGIFAVSELAIGVFSLELQDNSAFTDCSSAGAAKTRKLERVPVCEKLL